MIVPLLKCSHVQRSIDFYTRMLGFTLCSDRPLSEPAFSILKYGGHELHLSSHSGDGSLGNRVAIIVENLNDIYLDVLARGYINKRTDSPVHTQPTVQTWGTKEWYVDDPDGHTIRWVQRLQATDNL